MSTQTHNLQGGEAEEYEMDALAIDGRQSSSDYLASPVSSASSPSSIIPFNVSHRIASPHSGEAADIKFVAKRGHPTRMMILPFQDDDVSSVGSYSPRFVVMCPHPEKLDTPDEDLNEQLIDKLNARIGHNGDRELVLRHIEKMRRLGGLEHLLSDERLDIPSARMGLCFLSGINDPENKMYALESLLAILKQDRYHKPTAVNLIPLAIKLLEQMDRFTMQAETIEVQIKIAEIYNTLTEVLHHHYGKRHINSITQELKLQLVKTAINLERLNGIGDPKIKYHATCALEGVRRMQDDRQELFIVVERVYHALAAAAGYWIQGTDPFRHLEMVFRDLDPHLQSAWYSAILILKNLAQIANNDLDKLMTLQVLIGSKYRELNWKFAYAAVNVLSDIAMNGATEQIRLRAFQGIKQTGNSIPGLAWFASCSDLPEYKDMNSVKHLRFPRTKDPNPRIRELCAERLLHLAEGAPDESIRIKAQALMDKRIRLENDESVLRALQRRGSTRMPSSLVFDTEEL